MQEARQLLAHVVCPRELRGARELRLASRGRIGRVSRARRVAPEGGALVGLRAQRGLGGIDDVRERGLEAREVITEFGACLRATKAFNYKQVSNWGYRDSDRWGYRDSDRASSVLNPSLIKSRQINTQPLSHQVTSNQRHSNPVQASSACSRVES